MATFEKPPVGSYCPKCGQFRVMDAYTIDDLRRRVETGQPIDAWCQRCDEHWVFNEQERAGVAKGLAE